MSPRGHVRPANTGGLTDDEAPAHELRALVLNVEAQKVVRGEQIPRHHLLNVALKNEMMADGCAGDFMPADDVLSCQRRAEHIMAMPAVPPSNRLRKSWTAREVRQLIADNPLQTPRYELVDGELLVTPSPIPMHQRAVFLLAHALHEYLERNPVGVVYVSPSDVELERESIVQPDVFVVPMDEGRRILEAWPARELLVAAEVLSPSSGRGDRVTKRLLYGRHVPEYWIVDLDARIVERWQQHADQPQVLVNALEWHAAGQAEVFRLDLARFFAAVFMEAETVLASPVNNS